MPQKCSECGTDVGRKDPSRWVDGKLYHTRCVGEEPRDQAVFAPKHSRVVLTTAPHLEGYDVEKTVDVITAECVFGMNIFRDLFAGVRDVFGGRSAATQKVLRDARKTCLEELRKEAYEVGANAVIAVDLDYSEFSGQGKGMLFLVASGTAVKVTKRADSAGGSSERNGT